MSSNRASAMRIDQVDTARLLASVAVVWIHLNKDPSIDWTANFCRFAVPFFTISAIVFGARSLEAPSKIPFWRWSLQRIKRLYIPFVAWSLLYGFIRILLHRAEGRSIHFTFADYIWNGTALQLWFLPFILIVGLLGRLWLEISAELGLSARREALAWAILGVAVGAFHPDLNATFGYTGVMSWHALPSACWGFTLCAMRKIACARIESSPAGLAGATLWLGAVPLVSLPGIGTLAENASGLGFALLAFSVVARAPLTHVPGDRRTAMGIYLVHPFWLSVLNTLALRSAPQVAVSGAIVIFLLAVSLSYFTVLAGFKNATTRALLL